MNQRLLATAGAELESLGEQPLVQSDISSHTQIIRLTQRKCQTVDRRSGNGNREAANHVKIGAGEEPRMDANEPGKEWFRKWKGGVPDAAVERGSVGRHSVLLVVVRRQECPRHSGAAFGDGHRSCHRLSIPVDTRRQFRQDRQYRSSRTRTSTSGAQNHKSQILNHKLPAPLLSRVTPCMDMMYSSNINGQASDNL